MTSSTEVKLGENIYTFASPAQAQAFRECLKAGTLFGCKEEHPPVNVRTIEEPDRDRE